MLYYNTFVNFRPWVWALACSFFFAGCDTPPGDQLPRAELTHQPAITTLFPPEPTQAYLLETAAEALSLWRKEKQNKPTLLLFSKNPLLQPIPDAIAERALQLADTGSAEELRQASLLSNVDPVLLPNMTLTAALEAEYFSNVVWILPTRAASSVALQDVLQVLTGMGDISSEEAATFQLDGDSFVGTIRGTPFTITLKGHVPAIATPTFLHIDLNFLGETYVNEIRTPMYRHTYDLLRLIGEKPLPLINVSIAQSNLTGDISLKTRFLGPLIADIFKEPTLLEQPLSDIAKHRNEALYLESLFQKDKVLEICRQMVAENPESASAYYDLYQALRQSSETDEALEHLQAAANLDHIYASEYLNLANLALERERPDGALVMLNKAAHYFPDNHFIQIDKAGIFIEMEHGDQAKEPLQALQRLSWSPVYHADIPGKLETLLNATEESRTQK